MDGTPDCYDNSDECPENQKDIFSSNYHLVNNVIYRTALWIMAVIAVFGNGVSVKSSIKKDVHVIKNEAS